MEDALPVFCEYIKSLINVNLTPEHLKLAKYDFPDRNTIKTLWSILEILSYYAAREKRSEIDFRNDGTVRAVKMHLAFLRYPTIEFYSLSSSNESSRQLLIALAWLLKAQNVLSIAFRIKLANSAVCAECSHVKLPKLNRSLNVPKELGCVYRFHNDLHWNTKVNSNLREISELIREKGRLMSKVHAASLKVSGLPHLNVSELALMKRLAMHIESDYGSQNSDENRQRLREYRDVKILLDARAKWLRKRVAFFNWMGTVIEEHQTSMESSNPRKIDSRELGRLASVLQGKILRKLGVLVSKNPGDDKFENSTLTCPSRAYRSQCKNTEAENWLKDLNERQSYEDEILEENKRQLIFELKEMVNRMPFTNICL